MKGLFLKIVAIGIVFLVLSGVMVLSCESQRRAGKTVTSVSTVPDEEGPPSAQALGIDSFEAVELSWKSAFRDDLKIQQGEMTLGSLRINNSGQFRFRDPVVPASELTTREKMLLYGWIVNENGKRMSRTPLLAVNFWYLRDQEDGVPYATTTEEILRRSLGGRYEEIKSLETASPRTKLICTNLISPITGKLIEIDKKEFSPGNAYVKVIDDPKVLDEIKADHLKHGDPRAKVADRLLFVYNRIYGEKGIIHESYNILGSPKFVTSADFWGHDFNPIPRRR